MKNPTAAMIVIGNEILSGRTRDANMHHLAKELTLIGIDLAEARMIADIPAQIVDAVNDLRAKYTYVFTSGGIGPTHDDITADCIAEAFGVSIDVREDARMSRTNRHIVVGLPDAETKILLVRATGQKAQLIGKQCPGRVWLYMETENFDKDLNMLANGGAIIDCSPRDVSFGRVVVWLDPWGNRWGLIDPDYQERVDAEDEETKIRALVSKSLSSPATAEQDAR